MSVNKQWNILFIEETKSLFDLNTDVLNQEFKKVDKVGSSQETLKLMHTNKYDMIITDMSADVVKGLFLLKELTDKYPEQVIFALVLEKDEDKLFAIADLGVNAFELTPSQFEPAIEEIAKFNPYPDK